MFTLMKSLRVKSNPFWGFTHSVGLKALTSSSSSSSSKQRNIQPVQSSTLPLDLQLRTKTFDFENDSVGEYLTKRNSLQKEREFVRESIGPDGEYLLFRIYSA